jgi:hypothetical protein
MRKSQECPIPNFKQTCFVLYAELTNTIYAHFVPHELQNFEPEAGLPQPEQNLAPGLLVVGLLVEGYTSTDFAGAFGLAGAREGGLQVLQ